MNGAQGELLARAIELADTGASQDDIIATLQAQFPGITRDSHYLNPAAEAVMRRIVCDRARALARQIDIRRLREKGLPETLADRHVPPAPATSNAAASGAQGVYD